MLKSSSPSIVENEEDDALLALRIQYMGSLATAGCVRQLLLWIIALCSSFVKQVALLVAGNWPICGVLWRGTSAVRLGHWKLKRCVFGMPGGVLKLFLGLVVG